MLQRIMRMLSRRSIEFVLLFMFQSAIIFINQTWWMINAVLITILCILYIPLVTFVVPTLPKWYLAKIGDIPKFDWLQLVLCICYSGSAWLPILWRIV